MRIYYFVGRMHACRDYDCVFDERQGSPEGGLIPCVHTDGAYIYVLNNFGVEGQLSSSKQVCVCVCVCV